MIKLMLRSSAFVWRKGLTNTPVNWIVSSNMSSIVPRRIKDTSNVSPMTLLDEFDRGFPSLMNNIFHHRPSSFVKSKQPVLDFYETKNDYHIDCDVPGFMSDEIKVEWNDDFLAIEAEHKEDDGDDLDDVRFFISERSQIQTELYRKLRMPSDCDMENVVATFKRGILSIKVPKTEAHKKEILVTSVE